MPELRRRAAVGVHLRDHARAGAAFLRGDVRLRAVAALRGESVQAIVGRAIRELLEREAEER